MPQRAKPYLLVLAVLAIAASSGCAGFWSGYVIEPMTMGEKQHETRVHRRADARAIRTIGVINPFRLDERGDFICVGRDGQYFAERFDEALAARVITIDLPQGVSDARVRKSLARWSDEDIRRELNVTVAPDAFVFGSIQDRDFDLVPLRGYGATSTFKLDLYDRRGAHVWSGLHKRRGLIFESQVDAADRLIDSFRKDVGASAALARR